MEEVAGSGLSQDPRVNLGCFHISWAFGSKWSRTLRKGKSGSVRITTAAVDRFKVEEIQQQQQQYKSVRTSAFEQNKKKTVCFRFTLLSMSLNLKHMQVFKRGEDEWNGRLERNGWSGDEDAKYSLEGSTCPHWWLSYSGGAKKLSISGQNKSQKVHFCPHQLSLGSFYSFGNMMTYLTSYMRWRSFTWVLVPLLFW